MKTVALMIHAEPALAKEIRELSEQEERSISSLLRFLVKEALSKRGDFRGKK